MVYVAEDFLVPPSRYFKIFVEEEKVKLSSFEKLCKFAHKFFRVRCPAKLRVKLEDPIYSSSLKVSADEVFSLFLASFLFSFLIFLPISLLDIPSTLIFLIFPPFIAYNVLSYPQFYSEVIRIRAGNETVSIILYMVTYLSLNPVYEKAVQFAASRCHGPLGNDLKKVIWDVESGKFANIKEALASYSKKWILWNEDFVNSLILLQLIEIQPSEAERNEILKTATERMMVSTHLKMEKYAARLRIPSTLLMLFGIMLPLMGLVMFPLVSIFLTHSVNPLYIGIGYTVLLPFFLWWFLYRMIAKRPATYSHSEKLEEVKPKRYIEVKRLRLRLPIIPTAFLLGFLIAMPGLIYFIQLFSYWHFVFSTYPYQKALRVWGEYSLSRYEPTEMLGDTFRAMFVVWGIGFAVSFATYFRSKKPYEFDKYVRKLEREFEDGLFELQSALHQDIPVETAILKVIEQYKRLKRERSPIAQFFSSLYRRISQSAVSIRDALFGKEGLITKLPSSLIKNIMGIVTSALSKGPLIASGVAKNIVSYLSRLREIEHTIRKNMSEIVSNLTMQGEFITPFISGIVASSAVIIIQLLQAVAKAIEAIEKMYSFGTDVGGSMYNTLSLININKVMPPTLMELIAGIYLVESVIITAIFLTGIARGFDKVQRDYLISRMLVVSIILFSLVFFIMVVIFIPVLSQIKV